VKPIDRQQLINRVGELLQSKPQVLLDKWITIGKLNVSPVEYDDLVKAFAGQVSTTMKAVAMEQSDSREPISENLRKLLIEFDNSASMLGANQFAQVYSVYKENGGVAKAHCRQLIQALQQLERALTAQMSSEPNVAGGQAAA
jgi:hypothetical protein